MVLHGYCIHIIPWALFFVLYVVLHGYWIHIVPWALFFALSGPTWLFDTHCTLGPVFCFVWAYVVIGYTLYLGSCFFLHYIIVYGLFDYFTLPMRSYAAGFLCSGCLVVAVECVIRLC